MAHQDLQTVAFPTLDDVHVATLARFGTRRVLRDGEHLFKAGIVNINSLSSNAARWRLSSIRAARPREWPSMNGIRLAAMSAW
jgi:hypothetical protein